MKKTLILMCLPLMVFAKNNWGKTGHRTVGELAQKYISKKTAKKIDKILDGEFLAFVSIYADEIRSDKKHKSYEPWHYVNFEGDKKYKEDPVNPKGDILRGIKTCILKIRNTTTNKTDKAFYLKLLVHFVGDLHMPLHTGNKKDLGGNKVKVKWFGDQSNLHRVWDTDMIEHYNMSYSELSNNTSRISKQQILELEQGTLIDWVHESRTLALQVYNSADENSSLGYKYMYHNFPIVRSQLQKGGIRLAKILEETFKKKSIWLDVFLKDI